MKQNLLLIICVFSFFPVCIAQTVMFKGFVKNEVNDQPIEGASIVVKLEAKFLGYAYTDKDGYYELTINITKSDKIALEVKSLGYNGYTNIILLEDKTLIESDILLSEKIENLSIVVIKSREKIEINRDTIAYRLAAFKDGTEKNVEDMLKNLPGIEIDADGNIEALGKPIQKILIEGEDLANTNYKVISKNLDVDILKSVEIINNYDENPVLKQFLNSENVVINLKLKDDKMSLLFGKAEGGIGADKRYLGNLNLGLINPNFKLLNLGFLNNVGKVAVNQFTNSQFKVNGFNDFSKSFDVKLNPLVSLSGSNIEMEDENYIENESFSNSLLFNKTFSKKIKFKNTLFAYRDTFEKNYTNTSTYLIDPEPIKFTEQNRYTNDIFRLGNDLELQFTPSENGHFLFKNKISITNTNNFNGLIVDNEVIKQQLKNENKDFEVHAQYTKKINDGALVIDGFTGVKNISQVFQIRPNRYIDNNTSSELMANYESSFNYFGMETALVFKTGKTSHSYTIGLTNLNENMDADVTERVNTISAIDSLSSVNSAKRLVPQLQFKLEQPIIENLVFSSDVEVAVNFYTKNEKTEAYFLPNLNFNLRWNKTKTGGYKIGFEHTSNIERLDKFLDYFVIKSYRSIVLGAENIKPLNRNRYFVSHSYSNVKKRIFLSTSLSYIQNKNDFTSETLLNANSNISRRIYTQGQNMLFFYTNLTTYVDAINMSIKLGYQQHNSQQPSFVNDEKILSKNKTTSYILTGTTFFQSFFNLKFLINYGVNKGEISDNSVKNDRFRFEVDAVFKISEEWVAKIMSKNFTVNSQFYDTNQIEIEYAPKGKNWSLGLRTQNIFNDSSYNFQNVSDYLQSELLFEAVPRYGYIYGGIRF